VNSAGAASVGPGFGLGHEILGHEILGHEILGHEILPSRGAAKRFCGRPPARINANVRTNVPVGMNHQGTNRSLWRSAILGKGWTAGASAIAERNSGLLILTTTLFLVRHPTNAAADLLLAGRRGHFPLDAHGQQQARALAEQLSRERLTGIQSSPQEPALETARAIARRTRLPIELSKAIEEIDLGDWSGLSIAELAALPDWHRWSAARSSTRPPNGESAAELQARVVGHLEALHAKYPYGRIAIVSHVEAIRAVILHYLGLSIDLFSRVDVAPASVSVLVIGVRSSKIVKMNEAMSA
jgi:broad specificity phosphatase PhoE